MVSAVVVAEWRDELVLVLVLVSAAVVGEMNSMLCRFQQVTAFCAFVFYNTELCQRVGALNTLC